MSQNDTTQPLAAMPEGNTDETVTPAAPTEAEVAETAQMPVLEAVDAPVAPEPAVDAEGPTIEAAAAPAGEEPPARPDGAAPPSTFIGPQSAEGQQAVRAQISVAEDALAPGTLLLSRYEIVRVLGRGAMGEVLLVRDQQSGSEYALKRVPPEMVSDATQMASIRANFSLVSQLTHPNIATTRFLENDPVTKQTYLIMDFIHGQDLSQWMAAQRQELGSADAPLPMKLVLGIAEQIAAALDYAHSLPSSYSPDGKPKKYGILHRDLKPANAMVVTGREYVPGVPFVKLVDFGLAAEIQASMQSLSIAREQNLAAGTPAYMAPEQWEGRTLTRGVDQWALAVMIYEMVSGRRPYSAPTITALAFQIQAAKPEPPPDLTAAQWAVLAKAFQVDRKLRHRSCVEMIKALGEAEPELGHTIVAAVMPMPDEFAGGVATAAKSQRPAAAGAKKRSPVLAALGVLGLLAVLFLLAVGGGVGWWFWKENRAAEAIQGAVMQGKGARKASGEALASAVSQLQGVLTSYASRSPEELRPAREIFDELHRRQQTLAARQTEFEAKLAAVQKAQAADPAKALTMLEDAAKFGAADSYSDLPDLVAGLQPSLEQRRQAIQEAQRKALGERGAAQAAVEKLKQTQKDYESARTDLANAVQAAGTKLTEAQSQLAKAPGDAQRAASQQAVWQAQEEARAAQFLARVSGTQVFTPAHEADAANALRDGAQKVEAQDFSGARQMLDAADEKLRSFLTWESQAKDILQQVGAQRVRLASDQADAAPEEKPFFNKPKDEADEICAKLEAGDVKAAPALLARLKEDSGAAHALLAQRRELKAGVGGMSEVGSLPALAAELPKVEAAIREGDAAAAKGEYDPARQAYQQAGQLFDGALAKVKGEVPALLKLAQDKCSAKQYDVAQRLVNFILTQVPNQAEAQALKNQIEKEMKFGRLVASGRELLGAASYLEAEQKLGEALQLVPDDPQAKMLLAQAQYERRLAAARKAVEAKDWAAAKAQAQEALGLRPGDAKAQVALADAEQGLLLQEGDTAMALKNYSAAEEAYVKAVAKKPSPEAAKALDAARQARAREAYTAAMGTGNLALQSKQWAQAKTNFQAALTAIPNDDAALKGLAQANQAQTDETYNAAMEQARRNLTGKNWTAAEADFNRALAAKSNDAAALQGLQQSRNGAKDEQVSAGLKDGHAKLADKKWQEAKDAFNNVLQIDPTSNDAKGGIAQADQQMDAEKRRKDENIRDGVKTGIGILGRRW